MKSKGTCISVLLVFVSLLANGQSASPSIEWLKSYGGTSDDGAWSIQQTNDGGLIVAGYAESNDGNVSGNHGNADVWIVKLDDMGDTIWTRTLGGTADDRAFSIDQTADNGFIVAGISLSNDGDVMSHHGGEDFWIVRLDTLGDIIWTRTLGGTGNDVALSVQQTSDSGFIVAGFTESDDGDISGNHGGRDSWVIKLDAVGNTIWSRALGGTSNDEIISIHQTTDYGFIAAGYSESNDGDVAVNHGGRDFWIIKLNEAGNIVWNRVLGGSSDDGAYSIRQTIDGGYIVAGYSQSDDGDVTGFHGIQDAWVVKLDTAGNTIWTHVMGGTGNDAALTVQQTTNGGFIVGGFSDSDDGYVSTNHGSHDIWIVNLDAAGDTVWSHVLGGLGDDGAWGIQQTSDSGFVAAGFSASNDGDFSGNHGGFDFCIVKLSTGQVLTSSSIDHASSGLEAVVYPNPVMEKLFIKFNHDVAYASTISIYNILGERINNLHTSTINTEINVKGLPDGIYLLQIDSGQSILTKKFIKK